jgi:hypothetical protein
MNKMLNLTKGRCWKRAESIGKKTKAVRTALYLTFVPLINNGRTKNTKRYVWSKNWK